MVLHQKHKSVKKLLKLILSTALIVFLIVAIDFSPFEVHYNLLDWDIERTNKFFKLFLFTSLFCGGVEFQQSISKKKK